MPVGHGFVSPAVFITFSFREMVPNGTDFQL